MAKSEGASPNSSIEELNKAISSDLESLDTKKLEKICHTLKIKATGGKQELVSRLKPFKEDPALLTKKVKHNSVEYKFSTALRKEEIPPATAGWRANSELFPKISKEMTKKYQSNKRQGRESQYRKAHRMFSSRKMKYVKAIKNGDKVYVKSSILKSFSSEVSRTATILFIDNVPQKGFCECPVGKCGLCCHVIAILLQLEHFSECGSLFLSLTCTEKLQKWHRPCQKKRNEAVARTAAHIRLKYFRNAKSTRKSNPRKKKKVVASTSVKDEKSDWYKRDVSAINSKVVNGLTNCKKDIANHFLVTLQKYNIKHSGLYHHLAYKASYLRGVCQREHDYSAYHNESTITSEEQSDKSQDGEDDKWHSLLAPNTSGQHDYTVTQPVQQDSQEVGKWFSNEKTDLLLNSLNKCENEVINVKVPSLDEVRLTENNKYIDVQQGTPEWLNCRIGVITASKLPALLGFHGNKEFDFSWFCVQNKQDESKCRPRQFKNFKRGSLYEKEALQSFQKLSGAPVSNCGFFRHPSDVNYGASPDGISEAFLVEVKTRAENSQGPLEGATGSHIIQANFQMCCTGANIVFLQSYHPESKCSNVFFIPRNNLLIDVTKEITDHILHQKIVCTWNYDEEGLLSKLGNKVLNNVPNFEMLLPFRKWVNQMAKTIRKVKFV